MEMQHVVADTLYTALAANSSVQYKYMVYHATGVGLVNSVHTHTHTS